jgi:hypothetical protein
MHYYLYPTKDASITNYPSLLLKNSGIDEIIEIEKTIQDESCAGDGGVYSRALIQFDLTEISELIGSGKIVNPEFFINLKVAEVIEVATEYTIKAYPLAKPWKMGTGYKFDGADEADGVSWKYTNGTDENWYSVPSQSLYETNCLGGGVWYTDTSLIITGSPYIPPQENTTTTTTTEEPASSLEAVQDFIYHKSSDVYMNITNIVNAWLTGLIPNYGLILIHGEEDDGVDYGRLRFFSKETNTIYQPRLDVAWDDHIFVSSSLDGTQMKPLDTSKPAVVSVGLERHYKQETIARIPVFGRNRYYVKMFDNKRSGYVEPLYLPAESYYSIRDDETEEVIVPYDQYTKISLDAYGNYFMLDMSGLPQERFYRVEIKCEISGSISTYISSTSFKIIR